MNRNLDGTELSHERLVELALEAGMSPEKVTNVVPTWVFAFESRHLRLAMFMRGELVLDTRPAPRHAPESLQIDWEVVNFLRREQGVPA